MKQETRKWIKIPQHLNFPLWKISTVLIRMSWNFAVETTDVGLSAMTMVKIQDLYDLFSGRFTLKLL